MKYLTVKRMITIGTAAAMGLMLAGCGSSTDKVASEATTVSEISEAGAAAEEVEEDGTYDHYMSDDGWDMSYNVDLFYVHEEDGEVDFTYQGESSGSDMIAVSYVKNVMPQDERAEVLKEADAEASDMSEEEGFFGADGVWSYSCSFGSAGEGDGFVDGYYFIEHNGGSIVVEIIYHTESDEDKAQEIADAMEETVGTFMITDGSKQTEFDYLAGTYKAASGDGTIVINDDHTGSMTIEDTLDLTWSSTQLIVDDEGVYDYHMEGDTMYVQGEGETDWVEYDKQ